MSGGAPSPSVLSYLRQYRFQRSKNSIGSGPSGSSNGTMQSSNAQAPIRVTSSNLPSLKNANSGYAYKRIRVPDSDSDDAVSPMKRQAHAVPGTLATVELTTAVKERRFRNMSEMFPDVSPVFIKNTLVRHGWNEERTRDELLKHDPESEEKGLTAQYFPSAAGPSRYNGAMVKVVRREAPVVVRKVVSKGGGGRARRGSSGSEDDDFGVRKGKDDRVYDSSDSDNEVTDDLVGDKRKVFEFLNTSGVNELVMLSGCSQRKAEALIAERPFAGWLDMVQKLNGNKLLSTELMNATQELLSTRGNIQRLMRKCVGLAQQLEAAVAAGAGLLEQPATLDSSLKLAPYQLVGLNWLAVLHKQAVSGILADEMGLGKTVQVIAFLAHLKETGQAKAPHLIVVPASTLDNWSNELARWCPALVVSKYYGNQDERRQLRITYAREALRGVDVVLTTYTMVNSCPEERKMFRVTPMHYVIYDEAHMLKNMSTQRYDNLVKIKSKHRLLLTGTPLQNNLLELMSLLCFVMPHMFSGRTDDLKSLFQKTNKSVKTTDKKEDDVPLFEQSQITQAKRIMKPFVLRRLKVDVLQDLPKKTNHVELCPMSERQGRLYKELIDRFSANDGTIHATTEQNSMSMMMDMRKLANHPMLLRYHYTPDVVRKMADLLAKDPGYKEKNAQYAFEDMLWMSDFQLHTLTQTHACIRRYAAPDALILDSGKFNQLDALLPRLRAAGHRALLFSQFVLMLDVLEPYLRIRGYRYLRLDGSTAVTDRQDLINRYNAEDIFVFLLSTRAGGLGINLTAADTVLIHDIDFNPYNDKQAEDRCHRMGQKREVTIYRMVSAGTIEEGIYQVAQEKLSLEKHVTGADENEATEQKNVVRLLSSALGVTSPNK